MKKVLLLLALVGFLGLQAAEAEIIENPKIPGVWHRKDTTVSQEKKRALIGWDLNSVVFKKDLSPGNIGRMISQISENYGARYVPVVATAYCLMAAKKFYKKKMSPEDPEGRVWDANFSALEESAPTVTAGLRLAAQQANSPDLEVVNLLYKLRESGHRNAVLSNMGQKLLDQYVKALSETDEMNKTEIKYLVNKFLKDDQHKVISSKENNWMFKPEAAIYKAFLEQNNDYKSDCKIFIDDKKENCKAAIKNGFDFAIVCDDPAKLADKLEQLNVKK